VNLIFDHRWNGQHGIGRFSSEYQSRTKHSLVPLKTTIKPTSPRGIFSLASALKQCDIKTPFLSPGYIPPPLKGKRPVAVTLHDLNHIDTPFNSGLAKRLYYNVFLKNACRRVELIFTVSNFSKERISTWLQVPDEKIVVVGNGISSVFSASGEYLNLERPYFLCVSNRKGHKNELAALRAFAQAKASSSYSLLLTGTANASIQHEIDRLKLQNSVHFLGKLSDEELARAYRGAHALLFPSLYEGFGLPIVEAMLCRTLVIASNIEVVKEVSNSNILSFNPLDVNSITEAIDASVSLPPSQRNALLDAALKHASTTYSWAHTANKMDSALQQRFS
jgi:glycosyltransferase involved in cell wall biosynthesis